MTRTQTTKSITKKKAGLLLSTDRESGNILKTANSWQIHGLIDYPTLALTQRHMPTTTKNSSK